MTDIKTNEDYNCSARVKNLAGWSSTFITSFEGDKFPIKIVTILVFSLLMSSLVIVICLMHWRKRRENKLEKGKDIIVIKFRKDKIDHP